MRVSEPKKDVAKIKVKLDGLLVGIDEPRDQYVDQVGAPEHLCKLAQTHGTFELELAVVMSLLLPFRETLAEPACGVRQIYVHSKMLWISAAGDSRRYREFGSEFLAVFHEEPGATPRTQQRYSTLGQSDRI